MKVIGLCGGSGSGKGFVSRLFLEYGIPAIDTDHVYREMVGGDSPCLHSLVNEFGKGILSPDGSLNRKELASIVFLGEGAEKRLARLNEISHRFILEKTRKLLDEFESEGYRATLVDAPVLFESGFDKECSSTICVIADKDIRINRIMSRDGISREAAEHRINSQMSDSELVARCNYVITNNGDIDSLKRSIAEVAQKILDN